MNFDYFTTTLTISPLKNAPLLNQIGERFADVYDVKWLNSDFKKKEGYKRSIVLLPSIICTDRITAAVFFQSVRRRKKNKFTEF